MPCVEKIAFKGFSVPLKYTGTILVAFIFPKGNFLKQTGFNADKKRSNKHFRNQTSWYIPKNKEKKAHL